METKTLKEKIQSAREQTALIREQFPGVSDVRWDFEDIDYAEFKSYINDHNSTENSSYRKIKESEFNGSRLCFALPYEKGCNIIVISKPVKIQHTYTVIEEPELV